MAYVVSFPDRDLLRKVSPLPHGIQGVVWDLVGAPDGASLAEIDGVILPYIDASQVLPALAKAPNLAFVQSQSTGYDGILEAAGPGVGVANAAGIHAASTAELAVGLALAKLRAIDQAARHQQQHVWDSVRRPSLADRHVLILGVGGIGREVARRLEPFEVTITRLASHRREDQFGTVHGVDELVDLASKHDVVISVLPLNESTRSLLDAKVLAALPDGALVVNVGRGAVINTDALTKEVLSGRLECALDVVDPEPLPADHPLWDSPHALITPHIGGNSSAFEPRMVALLKRQLELLAAGKSPEHLVQDGPFA